jgi:hypothetical protein
MAMTSPRIDAVIELGVSQLKETTTAQQTNWVPRCIFSIAGNHLGLVLS